MEAGSLFQYFTTLIEKPILSSGDGSYLGVPRKGILLGRHELEEEKNKFGSTFDRLVNIFNAIGNKVVKD